MAEEVLAVEDEASVAVEVVVDGDEEDTESFESDLL